MSVIQIRQSKNGDEYYWVQVADNGEVLATSETYTRKYDAERGALDAADSGTAIIVDKTE